MRILVRVFASDCVLFRNTTCDVLMISYDVLHSLK